MTCASALGSHVYYIRAIPDITIERDGLISDTVLRYSFVRALLLYVAGIGSMPSVLIREGLGPYWVIIM